MPGLLGLISDDVRDKQLLDRMVNSIKHEQWCKVDRYTSPPFSTARVHLGIFNPEPQPVFNEDRTLCILMEGKVYGYDDEKKRLEGKHHFASHNDPEFCLHLYEELGVSFVERLNGAFVLLICDLKQKKAILANDRFGLMPFYYAVNNDALLFAPEAKALLQDGTFNRELDTEALVTSFAFGEFWGDRTLFRRVNILPPASILTYGSGKLSVTQYWRFSYQPDYGFSERAMVEQLTEAFRKAVALRMRDSLRHGISLSGGLDCRTILAAVEPEKRRELTTYSYGPSYCEQMAIARKVAEKCGTKHRFLEITPDLIVQNAEQAVWLSDGRTHMEGSHLHPIHREVRDHLDVVFDGFVLDRTLGGAHLRKNRINSGSKEELFSSVLQSMRLFRDDELLRLFRPEYHAVIREAPAAALRAEFDKLTYADPRTTFDEFYLRTYVAYAPSWHIGMRDLLEVSFPAVDNELFAIMFRIPPEKRMNHRIHRKVLMSLSPELARITYNKTMMPPSVPLALWPCGKAYRLAKEGIKQLAWRASGGRLYIRNRSNYVDWDGWLRTSDSWKSYYRTLLLSSSSLSKEYLNQDYISWLIDEHEKGRINAAYRLMRPLSFELFLRQFLAR
jgi:asparagine synthase (glutamine-hydrolysing)